MAKEVGQGAPKGDQVAAELVELAEGARVPEVRHEQW
jgi:hypothetical protein